MVELTDCQTTKFNIILIQFNSSVKCFSCEKCMVREECLILCLFRMFVSMLTSLLNDLHTYMNRVSVSEGSYKDEP